MLRVTKWCVVTRNRELVVIKCFMALDTAYFPSVKAGKVMAQTLPKPLAGKVTAQILPKLLEGKVTA